MSELPSNVLDLMRFEAGQGATTSAASKLQR